MAAPQEEIPHSIQHAVSLGIALQSDKDRPAKARKLSFCASGTRWNQSLLQPTGIAIAFQADTQSLTVCAWVFISNSPNARTRWAHVVSQHLLNAMDVILQGRASSVRSPERGWTLVRLTAVSACGGPNQVSHRKWSIQHCADLEPNLEPHALPRMPRPLMV